MNASKQRAEADLLRQNAHNVHKRAEEFTRKASVASTDGNDAESNIATSQAEKLYAEAAQIEQHADDLSQKADNDDKEAAKLAEKEQELRKQADELSRQRKLLTGESGSIGGLF